MAYRHIIIIAGLISKVSEEVAAQIAKNCRRQPPHYDFDAPAQSMHRGLISSLLKECILLRDNVLTLPEIFNVTDSDC